MTSKANSKTLSSRVARKRQDARNRIIDATAILASKKSLDQITVAEITETADVGHGSFYLHFKTKFDVLIPIVQQQAEVMDANYQQLLEEVDDPALVLAVSARLMSREIIQNPLWCWFLEHSGVPLEQMRQAFGRFSQRDLNRGLVTGRFQAKDNQLASQFGFGGFITTLMASLREPDPDEMIDDAVTLLLIVLGLDRLEAEQLAHQPLPQH